MTNPEAGWYDDPWSIEQYRYWDGNAWTHHAAPKHLPPQSVTPPVSPPLPAASAAAPSTTETPYAGDPYGPYGNTSGQPHAGQPYAGQPYPGQPYAGQPYAGQPYPGAYPTAPHADTRGPSLGPTTPDGVPLSGWWRRVGASLLDQLIVGVIALPLSGYFWYLFASDFAEYMGDAMDADRAGRSTSSVPIPDGFELHATLAGLITLVVGVVYQVVLLRRSGATWGKQATGIRVRLRDREGQLGWDTIARRVGFTTGLGLLSAIPLLGIFFGLGRLLDVLWPLWDSRNQALHDKVAATNVVRVP